MSRRVWKTVEASARRIGVRKTKGRKSKRERGEKRREGASKEEKS